MDPKIKQFIEDNIDLIEYNDFETLYQKAHNRFYNSHIYELTKTLHACDIYPEFDLNNLPDVYLDIDDNFENYLDTHDRLLQHLARRNENHKVVKFAKRYLRKKDTIAIYNVENPPIFIYNKKTADNYEFVKDYVTEIHIDDTVTNIPNEAFMSSRKLTKVHLGNKVKKIGNKAFFNCILLEEINFPNTLTNIGALAFYMTGLKEVILPDSILEVQESAFGNSKISKIKFSGNQKEIPILACAGCKNLSQVLIPEGNITLIDSKAFRDCISLSEIQIPPSVEIIGDAAFRGTTLISFDSSNVGMIGANAFENNIALVDLQLNKVVSIANRAFASCTNLREVTLPSTLKIVGNAIFADCNKSLVVSYHKSSNSIGWSNGWNRGIKTNPM